MNEQSKQEKREELLDKQLELLAEESGKLATGAELVALTHAMCEVYGALSLRHAPQRINFEAPSETIAGAFKNSLLSTNHDMPAK